MHVDLYLTNTANEQDRLAIFDPLIAHNNAIVGDANYQPLNVIIRNEPGQPIGGLWGHTAYGWFAIVYLFIPEPLRHRGIGTSMLKMAEAEALKRKCHSTYVDTHEFQARAFYEKLGFELFGELPDFPEGYKRFFLKKELSIPQ